MVSLGVSQLAAGQQPTADATAMPVCCPVVELRQYTLHPGQRDVLIDLFDREFVETQEAEGMRVIGQFRDLENPDRFVWLRGFADMPGRTRSLSAFYGGPTWKANRTAANATMIDSDNVLLLKPARPKSGFWLENLRRPEPGSTEIPRTLVVATIYYFESAPDEAVLASFEREALPVIRSAGASTLGWFVTESSPNTFTALPVREGEHVMVLFCSFADAAAYERYGAALERSGAPAKIPSKRVETLRLSPTSRSLLGHG